ncbi:protein mono-ADP-ribosyltransferase PARP9-like [Chanos chanos]|uniref:Protein mono-ADP-ribosyltransferase PARP9-like n=1 Tax=Chanos chanos TaxID=29144 RepID=A0A6J2WDM7_CHACN|nr:protein mono-ADP-ribosyltransferase PARP9-like [Chanos chanos]
MDETEKFPLLEEHAHIVNTCGSELSLCLESKFGCTAVFHGVEAASSSSFNGSMQPKKVTPEKRYSIQLPKGLKVSVWKDDLTSHQVDAVVNAANEQLQHGGGLALALANAGGPEITRESERIIKNHGNVKTGDAVVTRAGNLLCKRVIHAVGPYLKPNPSKKDVEKAAPFLQRAVISILECLQKENLRSVAIPALSSGLFNFPLESCAEIIVRTLKEYHDSSPVSKCQAIEVRLVNHDEPSVSEMEKACHKILEPNSYSKAVSMGTSSDTRSVKMNAVSLHIKKGYIQREQTCVIVNTTSPQLDLAVGAISKAILDKAGRELQTEIRKTYYAYFGDVIKTKGYKLDCQFVYHVLCKHKVQGDRTAEKMLGEIVSKCLHMAARDNMTSISFPAIGSGELRFKSHEVADIMTAAVVDFSKRYTGRPMDVHFILYPPDKDIYTAFEKELTSIQMNLRSTVNQGSISHERQAGREVQPLIELRARSPEAQREAKRWITDLFMKHQSTTINNNHVMHFGQKDHEELLSLQTMFNVNLRVFCRDGRAGVTITGDSGDVKAAAVRIEAMCCRAQEDFALAEESDMLHSLVRWQCKDLPDLQEPKINADVEKAYLAGDKTVRLSENLWVNLRTNKVENDRGNSSDVSRICFFDSYGKHRLSSGSFYERDPMKDGHSTWQRKEIFEKNGLQIVKVERVENMALRQLFELNGKRVSGKPRRLYQRVSAQFCELICRVGFQREYAPPDEQKYGAGIYFSTDLDTARKLWRGPRDEEYMYFFEAEVLAGKTTRGSSDMIIPPSINGDPLVRYDSVTDSSQNISVIFSSQQALPLYLITCKPRRQTTSSV